MGVIPNNTFIKNNMETLGKYFWTAMYCVALIIAAWFYYTIEPIITEYFKKRLDRWK